MTIIITPNMTETEIKCVEFKLLMLSESTCSVCVDSVRERVSALQSKLDEARGVSPSGGGFPDDVQDCPVCMETIDCTVETCISIYCPGSQQVPHPSAKRAAVVCSTADIDDLLANESQDSAILLNCGHKVHAACLKDSMAAGSNACPAGCNALVAPRSDRKNIAIPEDYYGDNPTEVEQVQEDDMSTFMTKEEMDIRQCGIDALLTITCPACSGLHHDRAAILQAQLDSVRRNASFVENGLRRDRAAILQAQLDTDRRRARINERWFRPSFQNGTDPFPSGFGLGNLQRASPRFYDRRPNSLDSRLDEPRIYLDGQETDTDLIFRSGEFYLSWLVLSVFNREIVDKTLTEVDLRPPYGALRRVRETEGAQEFLEHLSEYSKRTLTFEYNHGAYDSYLDKEDSFAVCCDYLRAMHRSSDRLPKVHSSPLTPLGGSSLGRAWVRMAERVMCRLSNRRIPGMMPSEYYNSRLVDDLNTLDINTQPSSNRNILNYLLTNKPLWVLHPAVILVDEHLPHDVQIQADQRMSIHTMRIPTLLTCLQQSTLGSSSYMVWVQEILRLNAHIYGQGRIGGGDKARKRTRDHQRTHRGLDPEGDIKATRYLSVAAMVTVTVLASVFA